MLELYQSILEDGRTPERVEVMMELTEMLYEIGYDDHLDEILTLVATHDAVADIVLPTEELTCSATAELLMRLGVTIDVKSVYEAPRAALEICKVLLSDLEGFDDHESLHAIMESGEPDSFTLANLVAFITGGFDSDYLDIIEGVSGTLLQVIRNVLKAKQLAEQVTELDHEDVDMGRRTALFMSRYPTAYVNGLLDDGGYLDPMDELIRRVELDPEAEGNYEEAVALTITGLLFIQANTYNHAHARIDEVLDLILVDGSLTQRSVISRACATALAELYVTLDEQEEVDETA